jgi:hypothetical protein
MNTARARKMRRGCSTLTKDRRLEAQASTETTLDKQLLTYSLFFGISTVPEPKLKGETAGPLTRLRMGLPTLIRLSMMPATSLLTLGPPKAPGPLGSGWRGGRGGGEGDDLGKGLDARMGERGTGEDTRLTGAEAEAEMKGAAETLSLRGEGEG